MVSLALALLLAAGEPSAPVAPDAPTVTGPALPIPEAPAPTVAPPKVDEPEAPTATSAATPTATPTPTPTPTATATATATPNPSVAKPRPAAEAVQRAEAHVAPARKDARPPVPALTPRALSDELKRSARERAKEQARIDADRGQLAKQAKEIADARTALRQETARLEGLLGQGNGRVGKPGAKGASGVAPIDALAKTVKGMKADQAAALLTRLDRTLAAAILARMRPADAAVVMDEVDPSVGAELFALLSRSGR